MQELKPTVFEAQFAPRFWRPAGFAVRIIATYRDEALQNLKEQGYPIARIISLHHQRGAEWVPHPDQWLQADIAELLN